MSARHPGIDMLKIMAMLMVVFYPACYYKFDYGYAEGMLWYIPNLERCLMNLCSMGVPLFFMCSGYCTLVSESATWRKMLRKVATIVILTAFWNYLTPFPVWFFISLAALYLATPALKYVNAMCPILYWCGIGGIFSLTFILNEAYVVSRLCRPNYLDSYTIQGLYTSYALVYYALGNWFRHRNVSGVMAGVLLIVGYALSLVDGSILTSPTGKMFDGVNASFPMLSALLMTFGMFSLLVRVTMTGACCDRYLALIASGCLAVFIFHNSVLHWVAKLSEGFRVALFNTPICLVEGVVLTCIVMILSLAVGLAIRKIPYVSLLLKL